MLGLFNSKTRKNTAREIKKEIFARRDEAIVKQQKQALGSDYWNRYQWQINAMNDVVRTINEKFNL